MTRATTTANLAVAAFLTFAATPAAQARDPFGGEGIRVARLDTAESCALATASPARSTSADCLGCHSQREHASHPVEVDYAQAQRGGGMMARDLRPVAELQRRGVRLVNGKVTCLTCHDARSPAANRIALPPEAVVTAAVDMRRHGSLAQPAVAQRLADVQEGTAVSPKALCTACHAFD